MAPPGGLPIRDLLPEGCYRAGPNGRDNPVLDGTGPTTGVRANRVRRVWGGRPNLESDLTNRSRPHLSDRSSTWPMSSGSLRFRLLTRQRPRSRVGSGRCSSVVGASEGVNGALGTTQEAVIFTTGLSKESCQVKCRVCPEVQPDSGNARSPDGPVPERRSVSIQPTRCLTSFGRNNLLTPLWTLCVPSDRSTTKEPHLSWYPTSP